MNINKPKISCIIPAYNEESRIGNVLKVVCGHPMIDEIIVVDDFSNDGTRDIANKFAGVKIVAHEKNKGKSKAVVSGVLEASGDYLLFLDADLEGLTQKSISDLIEPVISGKADVSISLRNNAPWQYRKIGLDFISGERVFARKLIDGHLDEIGKLSCYGLESFMNKVIIKNKCRIKVVRWENVVNPWKYEKIGLLSGIKGEIIMTLDVLRTISIFGVIYQIIKMSGLKVKEDAFIN